MKPALFYILSSVILVCSLLTVTSGKILRAAIYLLFVLIATSGIYFLMDYNFLAGVQLTLYAGGIIVLIIFAIMLTSSVGEKLEQPVAGKSVFAAIAAIAGAVTCISTFLSYNSFPAVAGEKSVTVKNIGQSLINYGENGYALPFEVISILLLAAMVAAIVIAKKATR
jgi:NADH-quinone oxidoreductase subunit J